MQKETLEIMNRFAALGVDVVRILKADYEKTLEEGVIENILTDYKAIVDAVDVIKNARKAFEEYQDRLSKDVIPEELRKRKLKTVRIEGVGQFVISNRFSCSILPDAKEKAYDWLRSEGHGSLITETVNSSTLSSFAREMLEVNGEELPDDMFKVGTQAYTSIRK